MQPRWILFLRAHALPDNARGPGVNARFMGWIGGQAGCYYQPVLHPAFGCFVVERVNERLDRAGHVAGE